MKLTPEYTAGLFDGDGTVSIVMTGTFRVPRFYVVSRVVNTYRPILDILATQYGGSVVHHMRQTKTAKQAWAWKLAHTDSGRFLDTIYPFVIVKKNAVTICRDFILLRDHDMPWKIQLEWKETINNCNARGPTYKNPRRKQLHALRNR